MESSCWCHYYCLPVYFYPPRSHWLTKHFKGLCIYVKFRSFIGETYSSASPRARNRTLTLSVFTPMYKWVPATSILSGKTKGSNTFSCFIMCYRDRLELYMLLVCDFIFFLFPEVTNQKPNTIWRLKVRLKDFNICPTFVQQKS